jgi:hypothetical protein
VSVEIAGRDSQLCLLVVALAFAGLGIGLVGRRLAVAALGMQMDFERSCSGTRFAVAQRRALVVEHQLFRKLGWK